MNRFLLVAVLVCANRNTAAAPPTADEIAKAVKAAPAESLKMIDIQIAERQAVLADIRKGRFVVSGKTRAAAAKEVANEVSDLKKCRVLAEKGECFPVLLWDQQFAKDGVDLKVGQIWRGRSGHDLRLLSVTGQQSAIFEIAGVFGAGGGSIGHLHLKFEVRGIDTTEENEGVNSKILEGKTLLVSEKRDIRVDGKKTRICVMDVISLPAPDEK